MSELRHTFDNGDHRCRNVSVVLDHAGARSNLYFIVFLAGGVLNKICSRLRRSHLVHILIVANRVQISYLRSMCCLRWRSRYIYRRLGESVHIPSTLKIKTPLKSPSLTPSCQNYMTYITWIVKCRKITSICMFWQRVCLLMSPYCKRGARVIMLRACIFAKPIDLI